MTNFSPRSPPLLPGSASLFCPTATAARSARAEIWALGLARSGRARCRDIALVWDHLIFTTVSRHARPAIPAQRRRRPGAASGCQDNQTSSDGDRNGLFTGTLLPSGGAGNSVATIGLPQTTVKLMPPVQTPNYSRRTGQPRVRSPETLHCLIP
jgi:hypothetical protein